MAHISNFKAATMVIDGILIACLFKDKIAIFSSQKKEPIFTFALRLLVLMAQIERMKVKNWMH